MRDDRDFLKGILERIDLTKQFTEAGREGFFASRVTQEAVIRNFEVVGEASRNVSESLRQQHPEVPWRQISAFRNFILHAYLGIKLEHVWQIIGSDLPPLKPQIEAILDKLNRQTGDPSTAQSDQPQGMTPNE